MCQVGPEPEAWHAPFCGAARILKMRILPPMAIGGVLLAAPGAGRRHWSPTTAERGAHSSGRAPSRKRKQRLRLPSRSFPFSHYPPYIPIEENNTENISLHKTLVPESWSTSENLGSINIDKLPRSLVDDSQLGIWSLASLDAKR